MNFGVLAAKNVFRNKLRMSLTVLGVSVAVLAFLLLRTVVESWTKAAEWAAKDRIATRNRISFILPVPKKYIEDIKQIPGVKAATWANWFGGKDPRDEKNFFATLAVDPPTMLEVFDEMQVPPDQKEKWLSDRQGALIGDVLARKLHVKAGDNITLKGTIYPGDWQFHVSGIYTATRKSVDRSQFLFHWNYLNDSIPEARRDKLGWIVSRIDDPGRSADISTAIDNVFGERDVQTITMSERELNNQFMAMFSAILFALNIVSLVILLIMMLILGNTIAMGVRERTFEYGVLRAIGFLPRHVAGFVVGEGLVTGLLGGAVGILIAFPMIQLGLGRWLEENMGQFFPYFRLDPVTLTITLVLASLLGAGASLIPALRASKLSVTQALRRVE